MKPALKISAALAWLVLCIPPSAFAEDAAKKTVERIVFHGNSVFDDGDLRGMMAVRAGGAFRRSFYDPRVFDDDLKNIGLKYGERGYPDARIAGVSIDSTGSRYRIDITIEEGRRIVIGGISFRGGTVFGDDQLRRDIRLKPGAPCGNTLVKNAANAIMTMYGRKGYLDVVVTHDIQVDRENGRATVTFSITEGKCYTIRDIRVNGLDKTRQPVVMRELAFRKGETVDLVSLFRSEQRLYGTGLFTRVLVQTAQAADDSLGKVVSVDVKERKSGEFSVGFGYESVERFKGKIYAHNNNFLGTARRMGCTVQAGQVSRIGSVTWTNLWTLGLRMRSEAIALAEYRNEPGYDSNRFGGHMNLGKTFRSHLKTDLVYRMEKVAITKIKSADITDKQQTKNLRSLTGSVSYDDRDDLLDSRKGMYIAFQSTLVGGFLSGTDNYVANSLVSRFFYPMNRRVTIGTALQFGWHGLFNTRQDIPLSERLYTGGPNTLRGFDYQKVGPLDENNVPMGGRLLTVGNIELRALVYRFFGFALFVDAGNVWRDPGDFDIDEIRGDWGFGPRVTTPVGIIRADLAYKIDRKKGESPNHLYFGFGQAF